MWSIESVHNPGWLFDIGHHTTQLYGDCISIVECHKGFERCSIGDWLVIQGWWFFCLFWILGGQKYLCWVILETKGPSRVFHQGPFAQQKQWWNIRNHRNPYLTSLGIIKNRLLIAGAYSCFSEKTHRFKRPFKGGVFFLRRLQHDEHINPNGCLEEKRLRTTWKWWSLKSSLLTLHRESSSILSFFCNQQQIQKNQSSTTFA